MSSVETPLAVEMMIALPPPSMIGNAAFQDSRAYSWRANSSRITIAAVSPWPAFGVEGRARIEERLPFSGSSHSISCEGEPPREGFVNWRCRVR
jgi:hypothetical protein